MKLIATITVPLIILFFISWKYKGYSYNSAEITKTNTDSGITILKKWQMPHILKEISGIASLNEGRFACIQDEVGKMFIFNTRENKIEKEILISKLRDFEGIAIVRSTAYLLRSDGTLFEAKRYMSRKPVVKEYNTLLNKEQNTEGLCYDAKHNRLLLAVKGKDLEGNDRKNIYSFDLGTKRLLKKPVYEIDLNDPVFGDGKNKKKMRPSDLAVHPVTGEIYILDGEIPKLLILDHGGAIKKIYQLSQQDFELPEGIAFTTNGRLFISNEGIAAEGNILEVTISNGQP